MVSASPRESEIYKGSHRPEGTFACMKQAYDLGINFFDTAER